jgi:2-polyprenyl-6-hydroxyphenyl methylase/3-demethylubiquinone-9 3-methyltransferase
MMKHLLRLNVKISQSFDKILPQDMLEFGTGYFDTVLMARHVQQDQCIMDIGGGKNPNISVAEKHQKNLRYIGIDIDENELKAAAAGQYDAIMVADICNGVQVREKADLIIARALMEHVPDTRAALKTMGDLTKPGGEVIIFVPCRNAWFTLINRILPESFKLSLLRLCFPEKMHRLGFKAFYNRCTPDEMIENATASGFAVSELKIFYASRYFEIFFPLHIIWRIYQICVRAFGFKNLCETFTLVLRKV